MWIRKEPSEIERDRKRKRRGVKGSFSYSILIFILAAILIKMRFSPYRIPSADPLPWTSFFKYGLPISLLIGLIVFLYTYTRQIKTGLPFNYTPTKICTKCYKAKAADNLKSCDCGGEFVSLGEMKWVEDDHTSVNL